MRQQITQKKQKVHPDATQQRTKAKVPPRGTDQPYLREQGIIGNHGVLRHYSSDLIQTKLIVGAPNDKYEQEADRIAETVMRSTSKVDTGISDGAEGVQRKCAACAGGKGPCAKCAPEEDVLQLKPLASTISPLIQRQSEALLEERDEEELLQAKGTPGKGLEVTPKIQSQITAMR